MIMEKMDDHGPTCMCIFCLPHPKTQADPTYIDDTVIDATDELQPDPDLQCQ